MVIHNIHNNIHSTSPPSRRRGLKYRLLGGNKMSILSPPSRRRGLKLTMQEFPTMQIMSPPSRRRGLKFKRFANLYTVFLVASFAEAWIEMYSTTLNGFCSSNVASFAEAWIEICTVGCVAIHLVSPPSRRRGLK